MAKLWNNLKIAYSLLFGLSLLAMWPFTPLFQGAGHDRVFFRYAGMLIIEGGMPYRDFFGQRPPLMYLLSALVHPLGPWGLWLLDLLFLFAAAVAFLYIANQRKWPFAWLWSVIFVFVLRMPQVFEGGGLTRGMVASLLVIGLALLLSNLKRRFLWAGLILGTIAILQPEQVLVFGTCLLWFLWRQAKSRRHLLEITLGALSIVALPLLWLLINGVFGTFWETLFGFNRLYLSAKHSLIIRPWKLVQHLGTLSLFKTLLFTGILWWFFNRRGGHDRFSWLCGLLVAMQLLTICISGFFFPHYFMPLLPLLCLLMATATENLEPHWQPRVVILIVGFLLFCPVHRWPLHFVGVTFGGKGISYVTEQPPLQELLEPLRGQRGKFFVWRKTSRLSLNTDYSIIAPSRWNYTRFWDRIANFDPNGSEFESVLRDIEKAKTEYVLDYSAKDPLTEASLQARWDEFIQANFVLKQTLDDGAQLWQRR